MVELKPSALICQQWSRRDHNTFLYVVSFFYFYVGEVVEDWFHNEETLQHNLVEQPLEIVLTIDFVFVAARIWDWTSQDMRPYQT